MKWVWKCIGKLRDICCKHKVGKYRQSILSIIHSQLFVILESHVVWLLIIRLCCIPISINNYLCFFLQVFLYLTLPRYCICKCSFRYHFYLTSKIFHCGMCTNTKLYSSRRQDVWVIQARIFRSSYATKVKGSYFQLCYHISAICTSLLLFYSSRLYTFNMHAVRYVSRWAFLLSDY